MPYKTKEAQNAYARTPKRRAYAREYYRKHKEDRAKYLRKPAYYRSQKYGLSEEDFQHMVLLQANLCAICHKPMTEAWGPCVDHNHTTGKIRGLLCHRCNTALGLIKENPEVLKQMLLYLGETGV